MNTQRKMYGTPFFGLETNRPWTVTLSWLIYANLGVLGDSMLTSKVGETDLVFGVRSGSLVGRCTQDYKSLCAAVTICSTVTSM